MPSLVGQDGLDFSPFTCPLDYHPCAVNSLHNSTLKPHGLPTHFPVFRKESLPTPPIENVSLVFIEHLLYANHKPACEI